MTIRVAPTLPALIETVDVNGTFYAFKADTSELLTLDLTNGNTRFVTNIDPAVGLIQGAAPVPEPASFALAGIGLAAIVILVRRRRGTPRFCGL